MTITHRVFDDHELASRHVAGLIAASIHRNPGGALGLATGSTPLLVYENLCRRHQSEELSFAGVSTFNLDEYAGLPEGHAQSYVAYMRENLFKHVDIDESLTHFPQAYRISEGISASELAEQYERKLVQSGGIEFQLLGIGTNGHIGFNEPGATVDSVTRLVDLAPSTIAANSRFFDSPDEVPKQALTMGIGTILRANKIVLMASGATKAEAVASAIQGPVSSDNPASFLQNHSDVLFILDREAASAIA